MPGEGKVQPLRKAPFKQNIIAIAGGKGGVGKTVLTVAMGIALAQQGQKTVVVDVDFGGANLHQALGIISPLITLQKFFNKSDRNLNNLLLETFTPNLYLLSGAAQTMGIPNIKYHLKYKLIRNFRNIQADYILLDIGAGTAFNELDFFLHANMGIVIITPEALSIQNAYNFIKLSLFRRLARIFKHDSQINRKMLSINPNDIRSAPNMRVLTAEIIKLGSDVAVRWYRALSEFRPRIVLNMLETSKEYNEGLALQLAANDILSLRINRLFCVRYDDSFRSAVKMIRPDLLMPSDGKAANDVREIVRHLFLKQNAPYIFVADDFNDHKKTQTPEDSHHAEIICSIQCGLWNRCGMQRGGYPCRIKAVGYLKQKVKEN